MFLQSVLIFIVAINLVLVSSVEISSASDIGQTLLSAARRLENGGDYNNYNYNKNGNNKNVNYYWMANYSLKFLGCQHIITWNNDVDDDNDVRIKTSRLARFRLCPSKYCSKGGSTGCKKGYGDYVVDIDTYVSAYVEAQRRQDEYECEMYMYKHCDCQDDDDSKDDGFDRDLCEYQCYAKAKRWDCIEHNPYYDDDASGSHLYRNDLRDFEKYFEGCSAFDGENRRVLKDGDDNYYSSNFYIGSYCADQGGKIYLGMFTDDSCTVFADKNAGRTTYKEITDGLELPFSDSSMVRTDCVSCNERDHQEYQSNNNNNNNNGKNQVRILDSCKDVYQAAGKCETHMGSNNGFAGPNPIKEEACYYLEGIKLVKKDGIVDTSLTRPNKFVSFFIFLFAVSFTLLGAFIYYLRMKLGMKINLE